MPHSFLRERCHAHVFAGLPETDQPLTARDILVLRTRELFAEAARDPERRQDLLDEIVTTHLWLADSLARRFQHRGEDDEDLLQVARTGLVEAAQRFDPEQASFLAFAVPTITGVLKRHFRDHGWVVRPPRQTQELASVIWRQWPALAQRLRSVPTERDLADQLTTPVASVQQACSASMGYSASSIDAALMRGISFVSKETDREIDRTEARLIVGEAFTQLTEFERELLRLRFCEQRSQAEIAAQIGTSQMQVSRLLSRLLDKLRDIIGTPDGFPLAS